jgi:hypothetical protein
MRPLGEKLDKTAKSGDTGEVSFPRVVAPLHCVTMSGSLIRRPVDQSRCRSTRRMRRRFRACTSRPVLLA